MINGGVVIVKSKHIIWGNHAYQKKTVDVLKSVGERDIVIVDYSQRKIIREEDGVIYLSEKMIEKLNSSEPGKMHYFYLEKRKEKS